MKTCVDRHSGPSEFASVTCGEWKVSTACMFIHESVSAFQKSYSENARKTEYMENVVSFRQPNKSNKIDIQYLLKQMTN